MISAEHRLTVVMAYSSLAVLLTLMLSPLRPMDDMLFWLDMAPYAEVIALVCGLALLPLRLAWLPVAIYLLALLTSLGLSAMIDDSYRVALMERAGVITIVALMTILTAFLAAMLGKFGYWWAVTTGRDYRADLILVGGTIVGFALFGLLGGLIILHMFAPENAGTFRIMNGDATLLDLAILRIGRLSAALGFLLLLLLEPLTRRHLWICAISVLVGLIMAEAQRAGFFFHPTLDPLLPLMVLAVLLRPTDALVLSITTLSAYALVTGAFSTTTFIPNHFAHVLEIYSVLGFGMLQFLLLVRFWASNDLSQSQKALARLTRVQAYARVGYFVADPYQRSIQTDPIAADILGTPASFGFDGLIRRVAPADATGLLELLSVDPAATSSNIGFRLAEGAVWADDATSRFVSMFLWYERVAGDGRIAYGAVLDLTTEHDTERRLREALAELSEQQNRQSQLFSIVSHELRTPAAIVAMLVEEMEGTKDWSAVGPKLQQVVDQLLTVLADMRQVVLPDQNLPVMIEPVLPDLLLSGVREIFAPLARAKGMDLVLDVQPHHSGARLTDRTRLTQAISNLIRNAILHSQAKTICLSYHEQTGATGTLGVWSVADDGCGIPQEQRENLFSPFVRGESGTAIKADGSGLGLYIVKSAMELLGGTATCSDRDGGGTVFTLRLPMAAAVQTEATTDIDQTDIRQRLSGMSILLAEDSELVAELLTRRIERVFGRVTVAGDGKSALDLQARDPHDVVLTDLFMPELGGDDLTRALRTMGFTGPVIGMTAATLGEERDSFDVAGANTVLTKPFRADDLIRALAQLL